MLKRIVATAAAFGAAGAGVLFTAPSASAQESGYACRSDNMTNHSWANWGGANVDSCIRVNPADKDAIQAGIGINADYPSDPCAQLVDAVTHAWVYNYGCYDTFSGTGNWVPGFSGNHYFNVSSTDLAKVGHPVYVQVGFWANFGSGVQYYMNVQSPEILA
ncbi:hypothetical protein [Streptacidiphilus melanogenes]|uniref:hypothetical protein n=1 Tax=Streptacidiphilus melanogenes TaxID=411235 RepID=UPI0005A90AF1|nr:hypothetical protein [Streptacidiphilus melanogenes]